METKHCIKSLGLVLLPLFLCLATCKSTVEVPVVNSETPRYENLQSLRLEKINSIDITEIGMFGTERRPVYGNKIDFDGTGRMYILDIYDCTISVFNEDGYYLKSLCRKGQGPKELSQPNFLFVGDDVIYVVQNMASQIKSFDLEGEYLVTRNIMIQNQLRYFTSGRLIYVFSAQVDQTFTKMDFIISRFSDDRFTSGEEIFRQVYPPGLSGPSYDFVWTNWFHVEEDGSFYFPEDNMKEFSIVKYNSQGRPVMIFKRTYDLKKYSEGARETYFGTHERSRTVGMTNFPSHPPFVRNIFVDLNKNIWIISGETIEDNENPEFENTVDIFDQKGRWLYSFKTREISRNCFYNKGRVYNITPVDPETMKQTIEVFRIRMD